MNAVIWLGISIFAIWACWNIYTKVIKNEGEELFLRKKVVNKNEEELDY